MQGMLTAVVTCADNKRCPQRADTHCTKHFDCLEVPGQQDQHALITIQDAKARGAMAEG
jgi:hypothetical protein